VRRQRTLDGEDRSVTIPLGRKVDRRALDYPLSTATARSSPARATPVATLPSALLVERFIRSVPVGCSRFSRCCHLIVDLRFHLATEVGPGHRRSHRNSALGRGASDSMNLNYAAAGNISRRLLRSGS
jgi:hypothetical protein